MQDNTTVQDNILKTPLHDTHVAFEARMVEFAGWSMPMSYAGITAEHKHTRAAASMFDVSHMGRLTLTGSDCEKFLNRICTRNLTDAQIGRCYYSHVCKEDGGILDDVIVSRFENHWGMVCNASNREKMVDWLNKHRKGTNVELTDNTVQTAMLAIQGPKTMELAEQITGQDLSALKRYHLRVFEFAMLQIVVYRSGYTGEDGIEVVVPAGAVKMLAPKILGTPSKPHPIIKPAGLGARDTLRIEAGMPLYGQELTEDIDSLSASQGWCVDLNKDFIGADAMRKIKEKGLERRLVGIELDGKRIARRHHKVYEGAKLIGDVTSGTLSPTLGKSIAMAYVDAPYCEPETKAIVELGSKRVEARIVPLPFYKRQP